MNILCDISFCTPQKKESHMERLEDDDNLHQNKDVLNNITSGLFFTQNHHMSSADLEYVAQFI